MRDSNSDRTLVMSWGISSAGMACPCTGPATCTAARYKICLQAHKEQQRKRKEDKWIGMRDRVSRVSKGMCSHTQA